MKNQLLKGCLILLSITILLGACRKDDRTAQIQQTSTAQQTLSLQEVSNWFHNQPDTSVIQINSAGQRLFNFKKFNINLQALQNIMTSKGNYWLISLPGQPTYQRIKIGYRKLAITKDSTGRIQARILEIIPDVQYLLRRHQPKTKDFTGRVFVYDQQYQLLSGLIYSGGKPIGKIKPQTAKATPQGQLQTQMLNVEQDCQWYDSSYIDGEGVFTIHSEQFCTYYIYDDGFNPDYNGGGGGGTLGDGPYGGGGGGGAPTQPSPEPEPTIAELPMAANPAISPKDYMKCFGNVADAGATLSVTVYVQQPQPGTSFPLGVNGVGHTAIGLSKTNGNQNITQVVGFYPASTSDLMGGTSRLVDNHDMAYNTSITYTVTADQFNKIAGYIANPPTTYDIYNFNCTNFAINACQQGGISLPSADTIVGMNGVGGLAHSMTPGGLGSSLNSLNGQNNVNNNGGRAPGSHGACN